MAGIKVLTLSPPFPLPVPEFPSSVPPSLAPHPLTPAPSTPQQPEDGARIGNQVSRRASLATFKCHKIIITSMLLGEEPSCCVLCPCLFTPSAVNAGSSGPLAAGAPFRRHLVVRDKDVKRANICTVKASVTTKGTHLMAAQQPSVAMTDESGGGRRSVHTVAAHAENRARGLLSLNVTTIAVTSCPATVRL